MNTKNKKLNTASGLLSFGTILLLFFTIASSCSDDNFSSDPAYQLSFSTDTLSFDTVFTTIGSATSVVMIRNTNNKVLRISSIALERGTDSPFRITVDGEVHPENRFLNVEIGAKDSVYILVSVTIDPKNSSAPILETDDIQFLTNGNSQKVRLEAYGQDVEILRGFVVDTDTIFDGTKPYLVYDSLVVSENASLTLNAGSTFYFYNNADFLVYGNLIAEGTYEQPIVMRGHRLDNMDFSTPIPYNYVAGQWGGVYLLGEGKHSIFKHVKINSSKVGIYLFPEGENPLLSILEITNSRMHNFSYYGVFSSHGNTSIINSEISNAAVHCVYLNGGEHTILQTTIANYYSGGFQPNSRGLSPAFMLVDTTASFPVQMTFHNNIIAGNIQKEFGFSVKDTTSFNGTFTHSYIASYDSITTSAFGNIRWKKSDDILFRHPKYDIDTRKYYDFRPDSVSVARGIADVAVIVTNDLQHDLDNNDRLSDNAPDAGAYEWIQTSSE